MIAPLTQRAHFAALADAVCNALDAVDRVTLYLRAECSDFIRFNHASVRQATHVDQGLATLAVVRGARRIESTLTLPGRLDADIALLLRERAALIGDLPAVPEDPYLLLPQEMASSQREETGHLPSPEQVVRAVAAAAATLDFVGFYAGGPVVRAFADSRGQRNWHRVESFHFEWCLYTAAARDKAVKSDYAGTDWSEAEFELRVASGAQRLALLAHPVRRLSPGAYRACFSPAAMNELLGTLSWGGFGSQARRTGTSSLMQLAHGDAALDARMTIGEATAAGIAPAFTAEGFVKPERVRLVDRGRAADTLSSPRSAREYGLPANGANEQESPVALRLEPGSLPAADALRTLDTGLFISNQWYLNYSDRAACRMTGMTRFACFWVERGELVAPLDVMRFDDSFLRLFGEGLVALTDRAESIAESGTYVERQLASVTTPSAVVQGLRLTL